MPDLSATRRDVLASIAVIAADVSGGGGDVADPIANLEVSYYRGPLSERPGAGVEGRVYETDAGEVYYDDGSSWSLVDRKLNSLRIGGPPTIEGVASNAVDQNGQLTGGSSEWTVNADGDLVPKDDEPINVQSATISELNADAYLDPNADDFGAELNSVLTTVAEGETIRVPPVDFTNHQTKATVDKNIKIIGAGQPRGTAETALPNVQLGTDVGVIETGSNVEVWIQGLRVNSAGVAGSSPAIECHGTSVVKDVSVFGLTGASGNAYAVYLHQEQSGDNLNGSIAENVSARNCDGVLKARNNSTDSRNLNGCNLHVRVSFQNEVNAVDFGDSTGNILVVDLIEGGDHNEGIRWDGDSSAIKSVYQEGNINTGTVLTSNTSNNTVETIRSGLSSSNVYDDQGGDNTTIQRSGAGGPSWTSGFSPFVFDGVPMKVAEGVYFAQGANLNNKPDPGEGGIVVSDGSTGSAGDLIYVYNDGGTVKTGVIAQLSNLS